MSDEPNPSRSGRDEPRIPGKGNGPAPAGVGDSRDSEGSRRLKETLDTIGSRILYIGAVVAIVAVIFHNSGTTLLVSSVIVVLLVAAAFVIARPRRRLQVVTASVAGVLIILAAAGFLLSRSHHHSHPPQASSSTSSPPGSPKPTPSGTRPSTPSQSQCAGSPTTAPGGSRPSSPYALEAAPAGAPAKAVAFSPNGALLAIGSLNATYPANSPVVNVGGGLYLWDVACASLAAEHRGVPVPDPGTKGVIAVAFSRDGTLLAAADGNHTTYLWNVSGSTPVLVASFPDPDNADVSGVAFGPGSTLVTSDIEGNAYQWSFSASAGSPAPVSHFSTPPGTAVYSLSASPDGRTLALGCSNGSIYLWNLATGSSLGSLADPDAAGVSAVAFGGHDGDILAAGDIQGHTYLWQLGSASGSLIASLKPVAYQVVTLAFNSTGTTLAAATDTSNDYGHVYLWAVPAGTSLGSLQVSGESATFTVAFSPDGTTLAVGDYAGHVYLWDIS